MGEAQRQDPARRQDGRRHLRGYVVPGAAGPRRSHRDDRQRDNALPIEYSEVSITRRMFRDGASEYEINGTSCRLMDVQELLSDSASAARCTSSSARASSPKILESRPEDRRAFIEEAAGVLKHRKRKEKAVRKLDSMSANLARLTDLTTELRRQLKPLGAAKPRWPVAPRPSRPTCVTHGFAWPQTIW